MSQQTNTPPSKLLKVRLLERDLTGFTGAWTGWWTAYQFDNAVTYFGGYIEGKLAEYDDKTHERIHSLEDLLSDDDAVQNEKTLARLSAVLPEKRKPRGG